MQLQGFLSVFVYLKGGQSDPILSAGIFEHRVVYNEILTKKSSSRCLTISTNWL